MNAVIKPKPVWQRVVEDCRWERRHGRDAREVAESIDDEDAARYIEELGDESLVQALADGLCDLDERRADELEKILKRVQLSGDKLPVQDAVDLAELLQYAVTNYVRGHIRRRIDLERLS